MFSSTAYAQTPGATQSKPSIIESLFPFILIFLVFYFLIIRPQTKQKQNHAKLLNELKKGDQVLTSGGILGKIDGLTEKFVTLEVANNVKIKMLRSQVAGFVKEKENE